MVDSVQLALLKKARDLAGGVSYLARKIGIGVYALDDMLHANASIPQWVFLRAVDVVNELEESGKPPQGFPANWQELLGDDATLQ